MTSSDSGPNRNLIDQASAWRAFAQSIDLDWPMAIETLLEGSGEACSCGKTMPLFLSQPVCLSDLATYVPKAPIEDGEWLIVLAGSPSGRLLALDYRDPDEPPHLAIVFPDVIEHIHAPVEAVLAHVVAREANDYICDCDCDCACAAGDENSSMTAFLARLKALGEGYRPPLESEWSFERLQDPQSAWEEHGRAAAARYWRSAPSALFDVVGLHHASFNIVADVVRIGDKVALVPEPENPYDNQAVRVRCLGVQVGYVRAEEAPLAFHSIRAGLIPNSAVLERIDRERLTIRVTRPITQANESRVRDDIDFAALSETAAALVHLRRYFRRGIEGSASALHPLKAGPELGIEYEDAKENRTRRVIEILAAQRDLTSGRISDIVAFCHLREEMRTFLTSRMRRIFDPATGEVLERMDDVAGDFVWTCARAGYSRTW